MKIKQNHIMLLREILVTQMNHWAFFPLYIVSVVITGDLTKVGTPNILFWLLSGSIPFLLYLVRTKLKFWLMILVHIVVIAILFFLPSAHVVVKILHVTMALVYVIYSIVLWANSDEKKDAKVLPLLMVGISVMMMYLLHHQNHREWDSALITSLIVVIGLYFINYYVEQYQNFLTVNQSSAGHIPAKEMFRSGMGLVFGYTGIGIVLLILVSNADWLLAVLNVLRAVLSFFVRLLQKIFPQEESLPEEIPAETTDMANDMMAGLEPGDGFWFWQVLEYVIIFILFAFFALVLIKGMIALIQFIKSKLGNRPPATVELSNDDVVDVREKCDIVRNSDWKRNIPFLNLNPKDRIRNMYKKRVLASRASFANGNAPEQLCLYTARESGSILEKDELAYTYEKARYSNEECNSEDVKRMKAACK